jgi:integrase
MQTKLTKRTLDAECAKGIDLRINDTELRGFHAKLTASGNCAFYLYYRTQTGTERRPKIGNYPELSPEAARNIAKDWLAEVRSGGDPSGTRRDARNTMTISGLCDRYIEEHAKPHKKPSSVAADRQLIRAYLDPAFGHIKVPDLTRTEVERFKIGRQSTPFTANRCLALLSHMMSLAVAWEIRIENPVRGIKRFRENRRDRYFDGDELRHIDRALTEGERQGTFLPGVILAIRLLALTGCRLGEILGLHWSDIDFMRRAFLIRDAKAGARTQTVGAPVLALLADRKPNTDGWVVEGAAPGKPLSRNTLEKSWQRIRVKAGLSNARLHDFRHTVATTAAQGGANAFTLRDLLGHKTLAMTARYVSSVPEQQRSVADKVAESVSAAMSKSPAEIIPLSPKVA